MDDVFAIAGRCQYVTRSGKIVRRLLREIAAGEDIQGDTSTLEDRSVLDKLVQKA
ncbi:MAG: hypothetical protein AAFY15_07215 [Cyanobacteria bacterium J06648_11]